MYSVKATARFNRDLKRLQKRGYNLSPLKEVVKMLAEGKPLPPKYRDHPLSGDYAGCRERDPYAGRLLNLRAFDKRDKMAAYSKQGGVCPVCGQHFEFAEMDLQGLQRQKDGQVLALWAVISATCCVTKRCASC